MGPPTSFDDAALRRFVDEHRDRCLWFLRPSFHPATTAEWHRVLDAIERYGNRTAFVRAGQVREWLSRRSSDASAAS